jgi:hypothetical protein
MHGWKIPVELQETINELTNYKYEDNWWYPDGYYGYGENIFLGDYIIGIPLGTAMSLPELSKEVAQKTMRIDGFPFDEVRLELANSLECYDYVKDEPLIYIVNSVN